MTNSDIESTNLANKYFCLKLKYKRFITILMKITFFGGLNEEIFVIDLGFVPFSASCNSLSC